MESSQFTMGSSDVYPKAAGVAPWERNPHLLGPTAPQSQAQAQRWQKAANDMSTQERENARRRRKAERAAAKKKKQEADRLKAMESNARRMYYLGFFFLPLVWLISLLYFHREHKMEGASPVIKKCLLTTLLVLNTRIGLLSPN